MNEHYWAQKHASQTRTKAQKKTKDEETTKEIKKCEGGRGKGMITLACSTRS